MNGAWILPVLLLASGLFSASETALFSLEPATIQRRTRGAFGASLRWCLDNARSVLFSILLSNLALNTLFFGLVGEMAARMEGIEATGFFILALMLMVVVAEILPKAFALGMAGPIASSLAPFLRLWALALTPLRIPFVGLMDLVGRRLDPGERPRYALDPDEILEWVETSPERFGLERRAATVISEIVGMADVQVRELMRPAADLDPIPHDLGVPAARKALFERATEWLLVEREGRVLGFVDGRRLVTAKEDVPLESLVERMPVIPETARFHHLMDLFKTEGSWRVLVVDEYGSSVGVMSWEDLCEDLAFGLAHPEGEELGPPVRLRSGRGWEVDGSLSLHDFQDLFPLRLPLGRNRTIGGWLVESIGHFPSPGEGVEIHGYRIEVLGIKRGRVMKVLVRLPEQGAAAKEEGAPSGLEASQGSDPEVRSKPRPGAESAGAENPGAESQGAESRGAESRGVKNKGAKDKGSENQSAQGRNGAQEGNGAKGRNGAQGRNRAQGGNRTKEGNSAKGGNTVKRENGIQGGNQTNGGNSPPGGTGASEGNPSQEGKDASRGKSNQGGNSTQGGDGTQGGQP